MCFLSKKQFSYSVSVHFFFFGKLKTSKHNPSFPTFRYFPSVSLFAIYFNCSQNLEFIHELFEKFCRYDVGKLQGMGPM